MNHSVRDINVCVFDAYGTLFDVHSAASQHSSVLGKLEQPISTMWREKQLQYTWLRSLMGVYDDFWTVTGQALDYAMVAHGICDSTTRENLMNAYLELGCFEEVAEVLRKLKDKGFRTAILSNGSPNMLDPVVENSGISELIDVSLSVDSLQLYKPVPQVYQMACDYFNVDAHNISFQSSNCWDAIGASEFGMQVVWCNRYSQQLDRLPAKPHFEIKCLTELLTLLGID